MRICVTLWAIWYARRKLIHGINQSPYETHKFVLKFISEPDQINAPRKSLEISTPIATPVRQWIPPGPGLVKIYVDAGVSMSQNAGTVAAICRDSDGASIGFSVFVMQGLLDPSVLEALRAGKLFLCLKI